MCNPFNLSPLSQPCIADDRPDSPVLTSIQPFQGESNFGDSSGPLFSIYSRAAEKKIIGWLCVDKEMPMAFSFL